jgi:hypothetical protein
LKQIIQNLHKCAWPLVASTLIMFLILVQLFFIFNQPWVSDYWEHRAVLQELFRSPFKPGHPILNVQSPHAFYSPYLVGIAFVGKTFSLSPSTTINLVTICNLLLFICSVWVLSKLFIKHKSQVKAFALLLLALLFFWGILPPYYSSFYHFISLPYVAAYPSTFAFSLSVFSASLFSLIINKKLQTQIILLLLLLSICLNFVVLLSHPLTYFFCFSMYLCLYLQAYSTGKLNKIIPVINVNLFCGVVVFTVPFFFARFWSYFPFYDLFLNTSISNRFHTDSAVLYKNLLVSYFPLILPFIILLISSINKLKEDLIFGAVALFLAIVYVYGFLTNSFAYGRVISFGVIWLQIYLIRKVLVFRRKFKMSLVIASLVLAAPFVIVSIKTIGTTALTTHSDYLEMKVDSVFAKTNPSSIAIHRLLFVQDYLKNGELVICDPFCSRYIPGLGGKVIANQYADYWVPDSETRLNDLSLFFHTGDSLTRFKILKKYMPSYLLLTPDTKYLETELQRYFVPDSSVNKNGLRLVKLRYN